ncbi:hypothetical protein K461DRAFT_275684 [Myriangium duriaei CBS 260.36]|uniref:Ricin B lectin domain-containing protein n=1 Tax=Myriangium duriaei CBS 260.36 TaxID=1168546 RepID=A0A9P4J4C2_9PEZI|nr:hypothetical protein K461DRAFT_275684 [Myriangium duriaei CBS 260.36]
MVKVSAVVLASFMGLASACIELQVTRNTWKVMGVNAARFESTVKLIDNGEQICAGHSADQQHWGIQCRPPYGANFDIITNHDDMDWKHPWNAQTQVNYRTPHGEWTLDVQGAACQGVASPRPPFLFPGQSCSSTQRFFC